ncbi:MAG: enoyl-CoA hydratase [Gammaproteobacteria bacterium]|uniref:enoyl-CoA hydratase-related protein n=1 Tax=Pseudomaricurvus alcaniphilus TaxID=1166482 RepID=UPI00140813E0|nr:enoyl-CoA hydratase-related protein [Pseudomaricurvus alcaniphilus]MBR9912002.1 enoyl-CoA hydratase [Gammaproteobacteria bacterium]NHN39851.1 enoyl-CoA hydratase [Pseudomaricurvus alcaniphilus]
MKKNEPTVLTSLENRVLTITLNRPQARNSINGQLTVLLHQVVSAAAKDDQVGAIVLTGADKEFCVGSDIHAMGGKSRQSGKRGMSSERLLQLGAEISMLLHKMPKPTIAMIRGTAAGSGLSLAAACDFRFADWSAKLCFANGNIGLSGDFGGAYFLQQLLGVSQAREFCLLTPKVPAQEAASMGLVTRCVPDEELEQQVYGVARQLAMGPAEALGRIKQNLNIAITKPPTDYLRQEVTSFMRCRSSAEHKEAVSAFIEKREPVFYPDK